MGKLRVYCLKTLNKLSIYPLGYTPSAPSVRDIYVDKEQDKFFHWLNRQQVNINALKDCLEQSELRVRALELENELLLARLDSIVNKLCFCTQAEVISQVDSFVILIWLRKTDVILRSTEPSLNSSMLTSRQTTPHTLRLTLNRVFLSRLLWSVQQMFLLWCWLHQSMWPSYVAQDARFPMSQWSHWFWSRKTTQLCFLTIIRVRVWGWQ